MPSRCREEDERHQGEAAEGEERNATSDLPLKHPNVTLAAYV
jgi:hypothetical protein